MFARGEHAASDNTETYEALYDRYRGRLVRYCRRRLWNKADAEDAAHETLLRAFRALPAVDLTGDPWPWLTTIAGRICTDVRRRAARPPLPTTDVAEEDVVHEAVVERLRADILDDALRRLPDHYRTSLLLREYGGWAYDDIARLQGRSVGSVRSLLARSRRRLEVQVETVARTRNQWPLPATVPPIQRLREQFRAWRESLERSPQALLGTFEFSSVATRWIVGAQATLATMMTFAGAVVASVYPLPVPPSVPTATPEPMVTAQVRGSDIRLSLTAPTPTSADPTSTPAAMETVSRVDITTPSVAQQYDSGLGARSSTKVQKDDDQLYIETSATVPVLDEVGLGRTWLPCQKDRLREITCAVIRTAAEELPGE